jgi:5-methylcytosine-specific restriction endonuclease McrA
MSTQSIVPTQTLILSASYEPLRVVPWEDAIVELFTDKVEVLVEYDEVIYRNEERGVTMRMPAVAKLIKSMPRFKKGVKFSRINVMVRDGFTCCYCGTVHKMGNLNRDHVLPRSKGGKTDWTNIVSSCYACNDKKGSRTPEQAKMKLLKKPYKPKTLPLSQPGLVLRGRVPEEWKPYLPAEILSA